MAAVKSKNSAVNFKTREGIKRRIKEWEAILKKTVTPKHKAIAKEEINFLKKQLTTFFKKNPITKRTAISAVKPNPELRKVAARLKGKIKRSKPPWILASQLTAEEAKAAKHYSNDFAIFQSGREIVISAKNGAETNAFTAYRKLLEQNNLFYILYGHGTASEKAKANRLWKKALEVTNKTAKHPNRNQQYGKEQLTELSQTFQGKLTGKAFYAAAPDEMPKDVSRLGELRYLKIKGNDGKFYEVKFDSNADAWAVADLRKNIWLIGKDARTKNLVLPPKNSYKKIGVLYQGDYLTAKAHIENNDLVHYFHKLGEVDGQRPTVLLNHEGFLLLIGGNYDIGVDGIEN